MKEPEINDPSLLRCTVKKSIQVIKKLSLYVVALAALAIIGYGIYLGLPTLTKIAGMVVDVLVSIVTVLVSIPWYFYAGAVAIAAIPVYSFVWCITRELMDEDWNSNTAETVAFALAFALAAFALAFALAAFALAAIALALAAIALALAAIAAFAVAFAAFAVDTKPLLFIGAYLHYRKRMKNLKIKRGENYEIH
jgi:hypothetical protein